MIAWHIEDSAKQFGEIGETSRIKFLSSRPHVSPISRLDGRQPADQVSYYGRRTTDFKISVLPNFPIALAEIGPFYFFVLEKHPAFPLEDDFSSFQHIATIRYVKGGTGVLFD
jgi:hypothetical protein